MTTRDHHSPANMDPSAYRYEGTIYQGPTDNFIMGMVLMGAEPEEVRAAIDQLTNRPLKERVRKEGKYRGNWRNKSTCDHCGAYFHYGDVYQHEASGELIVVGWICSEKTFSYEDRQSLDHDRRKREVLNARMRGQKAKDVRDYLDANPELEVALLLGKQDGIYEEVVLDNMRCRLLRWGPPMTNNQVKFALILAEAIRTGDTREGRKKRANDERVARLETAAMWESGRQEVEGVILSVRRPDEYAQFATWKMLVELEDGRRCWGSIPNALTEIPHDEGDWRTYESLRGEHVTFHAAIKPKEEDLYFAFYSRPTKAKVVEHADICDNSVERMKNDNQH